MKDAILDIVIELFFAVVCLLLSFAFWNFAAETSLPLMGIRGTPGKIVLLTLIGVNLAHFFHGWFHTPDDVAAVAPDRVGWMQHPYDSDRVWVQVIATLTVGFSDHSQKAIATWKRTRDAPSA